MRYIRARFKGYIGFYNGMGLEIVDIDFSKCVHNIVLILGGNGSGKSTLLNSLNIFPDSSSSFIPNKDAEKYLVLQDEINIYEIRILSASDLKGGRKTTKAYIKKNGLELNANGNVSSYKEIIFSEFDLDSNYISLSKLSNDDRGLGDKKPAERKKFASSIIENLETYNNIYKILNKKSLVYKSHLNTLHTKIQNIGIKESLEKNLNDLRIKESNLNNSIMEYNNAIVSIQAKNSIDEEEAKLIHDLSQSLERSEKELNELQISLDKFINSTKIKPENLELVLEENKNLLSSYKAKLESTISTWKIDSERLNTVSNNIRSLEAQLSSPDYNSNISQRYNDSNNKIKEFKNDLLSLNLLDIENGSIVLENFLVFCQKFIESIEVFVDDMTPNDIEFVKSNNPDEEYSVWSNKQNSIILSINNIKDSIAQTREEMNKVSSFESRPKDCKNNNCPFIRDGYKIIKSLDGEKIEDKLFTLHDEMDKLSKELTNSQNMMDYCRSMMHKRVQYDSIRKSLSEYQSIILLLDPELINNFDIKLANMDFNFERDPRRIVDGLNLYKLLDLELETNKLLSVEYKSFEEKIQLINSSKSILENLKTERDGLIKVINDSKSSIDSYNSLVSQLESNISIQSEYMIEYKKFNDKTNEYISYESKMEEFSKKSEKSAETLKLIEDYKSKIAYLSSELKPVMQGISHISGQLTLIDSY